MRGRPDDSRMPGWLIAAALLGSASALAGGFWDDAWHTERGRDGFFIAPHIAIYAGVAAIGAALSLWVFGVARREGAGAMLRDRIMLLAAISVVVTLVSAPIDTAWHEAFGRDAVAWSPPHMLGVVGTLGLGAALLASLSGRRVLGASPAGWSSRRRRSRSSVLKYAGGAVLYAGMAALLLMTIAVLRRRAVSGA